MVGRLSLKGLCIKRGRQANPILECFFKESAYDLGKHSNIGSA
jgi:hypothetical protein